MLWYNYPKESLRFNQEKSCRMYMRRILERESLLFYKIGARIEESDCPEEAKEEIRNHLELLEELFVTDVSKPRERIVFLRGDKLTEWTDLRGAITGLAVCDSPI